MRDLIADAATLLLLAAAGLFLFLVACDNPPPKREDPPHSGWFVVDVDGRKVPCISAVAGMGGGISCDWD